MLDKQVVVREGEKNQSVTVVLGAGVGAPAPVAGSLPKTPAAGSPSQSGPATRRGESSSTWKTVGWVLGGAGVIGLGVGATLGVIALGDKNNAHCMNNVCDPGSTGGIRTSALASDVGWIAGGVLLGAGAGLVLFAPSTAREPSVGVSVAPVVSASTAAVVASGTW